MTKPENPTTPMGSPVIDDATRAEHVKKMKRMKAEQDAEVRTKTIKRGVVIVHTGDGKGKSTAGFGVAIRAAGHGQKVAIIQFIKGNWKTGEQAAFKRFPEITHIVSGEGFTWNSQDLDRDIAATRHGWEKALECFADPSFDVVILDELNIALRNEYLNADEVALALRAKRAELSIVVTGRGAPAAVIEAADTVSDHTMVKHAYSNGIRARRGIEF